MVRKLRMVTVLGVLAVLGLALTGCFPVVPVSGDEPEPDALPPVILTGIDIEMVITPYFWPADEFGENYFPEGETLRCTVRWEDTDDADAIAVDHVNWLVARVKPDDGWRFVPGGTDGGAVDGEYGEVMYTSDAKPLVGCGCPKRCPDGPEIWDYDVITFVYLTNGDVLEARQRIHVVPLNYYYQRG